MPQPKYIRHILIGATAVVIAAARFASGDSASSVAAEPYFMPGVAEAASLADVRQATTYLADAVSGPSNLATRTRAALDAVASSVRPLSHPSALEDAFSSYFAYKASHPDKVRKPYLYFVDYGLSNTTPRGYVFDMERLAIVQGPFTVAAGRGSPTDGQGVPRRFSNVHGSAATSLGLYLAQETYSFSGKASGRRYKSIGLRLKGLSGDFNDNARTRGVVAHGAPYVTASRAGRSEGCPAVEESLARTLLPKLANGGMVFLFAPDHKWMANDPWLTAAKTLAGNVVAGESDKRAN